MKILIGQPIHEKNIDQLENEIKMNREVDIVLFPEGYLSNEKILEEACEIAKKYNVAIITSYRCNNRDRAIVINNCGEKILERAKTPPNEDEELYTPMSADYNKTTIGYLPGHLQKNKRPVC